jgi:hypothetical protein
MGETSRQNARANRLLLAALNAPQTLVDLTAADWELLLRVARRVRLLGRLEVQLSRAGLLNGIPARAANHLRAARTVIEHRRTLVAWEVNRLLWGSRETDIPLILLKGSAYVLADLPSASGRLFADIDLLVPEANLSEVEDSLVRHGWLKMPVSPYDDRYYRVWMHEIPPLRHRERGTEIDIHHRILPRTSRLRSEPAALFADARPLQNRRLKILAPADMVLHALVHLFLEGDPEEGLRFRDLLDVHDLLQHYGSEPGFWEGLAPRARQLGWQRPLFYGLRFAQRLFGTEVPQAVLEAAAKDAPPWPIRILMDKLVPLALLPGHPDFATRQAALARQILYLRAHWLRMPLWLLIRHLTYKSWLRFRGVGKQIDLARLDLRQQ